ncbi:MAG TPA: hypothetical protein VGR71_13560, partial [Nitrospira sp.]|nr:hypothetical protein [Nitrospira sp.]
NDQRTINNILAMLTKVHEGLVEETRKTLNVCKYAWQARLQLLATMHSKLGPMIQSAYDAGKFFGKYDNFTLTSAQPELFALDYTTLQVSKFSRTGKKKAEKTVLFHKMDKDNRQLAFDQIKATPAVAKNFMRSIEVEQDVIFILNDLGIKGTDKFIQAYVQGHDDKFNKFCKIAYVFSVASGKSQMSRMNKEFKKAMNIIGNPPHITVSYLKENFQHLVDAMKPTPRPRVSGVLELRGDGYSYRGVKNSGWSHATWRRIPTADVPAGVKFYVPVEKRIAQGTFTFFNAKEFVNLIHNAKDSKLFPLLQPATRVFALPVKSVSRMDAKEAAEWVNVLDYIAETAPQVITDAKVLELSIQLEPFSCPHEDLLDAILKREKEFKGNSLLEFAKSYFAVRGVRREEKASATAALIQFLTAQHKYKRGAVINFKTMWRSIVAEQYPILALSFSKYSPYSDGLSGVSYEKSMLQYVKLMDAQRKEEAI